MAKNWTPEAILALRMHFSLTQEQLADLLTESMGGRGQENRVPRNSVCRWENAKRKPNWWAQRALDQVERQLHAKESRRQAKADRLPQGQAQDVA